MWERYVVVYGMRYTRVEIGVLYVCVLWCMCSVRGRCAKGMVNTGYMA